MIRVEIDDLTARQAFDRLLGRAARLQPLMQQLGEHLTETTKQRFGGSLQRRNAHWCIY